MNAPRRPPTGAQPRAERTRAAVIDETVRCILDDGFAPPSVRRITDRAGVTWGVVQYHFGDLDGLLMAVVDTGFGELLATLQALESETAQLDRRERVAFVVNAVWQAFSSPTSRAAIEILISTRGARTEAVNAHLVDLMAQLTAFGRQLGEGLSAPHATRVGTLIWNTLRGIVAAQMMWHEPMDSSRDLQTLIDVVSAYIELRT
ncbi:TetR/AcrR family transcriptional regulator [Mycolicibacterium iranicum]|uniref:TetR family transcriptional regulator n=1 Tax=Mycolicibacterium iranicum TaxID=912594 RepID=A0A178LYQ3_MYCIR|nr:TetR/AcrR family transcriptional regulator [Mycolicibacterium iranicum]OAN39303.1 TetR family transcriptional regulator [Mycolicibacterium iranicum]